MHVSQYHHPRHAQRAIYFQTRETAQTTPVPGRYNGTTNLLQATIPSRPRFTLHKCFLATFFKICTSAGPIAVSHRLFFLPSFASRSSTATVCLYRSSHICFSSYSSSNDSTYTLLSFLSSRVLLTYHSTFQWKIVLLCI